MDPDALIGSTLVWLLEVGLVDAGGLTFDGEAVLIVLVAVSGSARRRSGGG